MVLVVDPQIAGISGDMFLCALADLGANRGAIVDGVRESARFLDGSAIDVMEFRPAYRRNLLALELVLDARDTRSCHACDPEDGKRGRGRSGTEMVHAVERSSAHLGLSGAASEYAFRCIDALVRSESRVHGVARDSVVFHEMSHVDTLVDIIGTAIALDDLDLLGRRITCLPVCVGGSSVKFSHGITSNPAGAILQIFGEHGLWMRGSQAGRELTTPTGACMLAALRPEMIGFYPHMQVDSIGYGAGRQDFEGFANVLKLVCGPEPYVAVAGGHRTERVCMLETNVDDVSGEVLGGMIGKMMGAGAKDVSICQGITKKNRPTNMVSVMCDGEASGRLIDLLMSETGTLGVRVSESERVVVPRTSRSVRVVLRGKPFDVRYKRGPAGAGFKIEFDDLQTVSDTLGMPIREAEYVLRASITQLDEGDMLGGDGSGSDEQQSGSHDTGTGSHVNGRGDKDDAGGGP